ncbi:hypothetical protein V1478_004822 [Vespula squamosa]|uniref:Uncharacterized protein n=1 Tax=Vespula squamosa TaxID=30214 RepID=A0ABD2BEU0_VESSQ
MKNKNRKEEKKLLIAKGKEPLEQPPTVYDQPRFSPFNDTLVRKIKLKRESQIKHPLYHYHRTAQGATKSFLLVMPKLHSAYRKFQGNRSSFYYQNIVLEQKARTKKSSSSREREVVGEGGEEEEEEEEGGGEGRDGRAFISLMQKKKKKEKEEEEEEGRNTDR